MHVSLVIANGRLIYWKPLTRLFSLHNRASDISHSATAKRNRIPASGRCRMHTGIASHEQSTERQPYTVSLCPQKV